MSKSTFQPLNDFNKGQIHGLRIAGWSYRDIAAKLNLKRSTIHSFMKRFNETNSYERKPGSGKKTIVTEVQRRYIIRKIKIDPNMTPAGIRNDNPEIDLSNSTIRRVIVKSNLFKRRSKRKIPLINEINKKKRLTFAKTYNNKPEEFWDSIIWSDESTIMINKSYNGTCWYFIENPNNPLYFIETEKFPAKIMVWACFSSRGKSNLVFIDGSVNSDVYQQILQIELLGYINKYFPDFNYIFQQDNAPCHNSKSTKQYLKSNNILKN